MTKLFCGDCLQVLKTLEAESVDSVVTDPPYGLSFMDRKWDYEVPSVEIWEQCLRVLKPGGHLLAFAGARTQHRMCVNIEDAGFEIRDMIAWVYGTGFPKSMNVSKAIDGQLLNGRSDSLSIKKVNEERPGEAVVRSNTVNGHRGFVGADNAGQSVKRDQPATPEAQQWDGWGTALKPALEPITVARKPFKGTVANNVLEHGTGAINIDGCRVGDDIGRWPANLIHDGSDGPCELLGDAARFFYCAKANKKDREEGNSHPTVKPTDLMAYLCRLVTPPGGIVLDPFMGSGSTGKAAMQEGFNFVGIEREQNYFDIAEKRLACSQMSLM